MEMIKRLYRLGTINVQRYRKGSGGYHHWHSELYPCINDPHFDSLYRVLLFMYYLNEVAEGCETSFFYQDRKILSSQGTLVIAPAYFTHIHKGEIPLSCDKYILTTWVLFRKAEELYQGVPTHAS